MKLNKRTKLIHGIGINDADYNVVRYGLVDDKNKIIWHCPFYVKWKSMVRRCYSENCKEKKPSYIGCSVVKEWHLFSNFKAWMETQDWQGKHLDKDILFPGNKEYGPDTCVFVSKQTNLFIIESSATRGKFLIGVAHYDENTGKYMARCGSVISGKQVTVGRYSTELLAHEAWLAFKLEQAYFLAQQQTDERVAKALIDRYENYGNFTKGA